MGEQNFERLLQWCRVQSPLVRATFEELNWARSHKFACCVHLDLKMVPPLEAMLAAGAQLYLCPCNPATTDRRAVAHLAERGAVIDLEPEAETRALAWAPDFLVEFGAALTLRVLDGAAGAASVRGSLEGTGSGVAKLRGCSLPYPVLNWDGLALKTGIHNRHMVGLCAWHTFFNLTYLTLHGRHCAVVGFGPVGQGVADSARHFGGQVTVVEVDPDRRLLAQFQGWPVSELETVLPDADVVVTATGAKAVLNQSHWSLLKNGAILLNVGHHNDEIQVDHLPEPDPLSVLPHLERYQLADKHFYLLARGQMLNLAAGFGDSINSFDLTLALMMRSLASLVQHARQRRPGLYSCSEWSSGSTD